MSKQKIHAIHALRMHRPTLLQMIFGDDMKHIDPIIPENLWTCNNGKYHQPTHVMDDRRVKPVNIIEVGIKKGIIKK